MEFWQQLVLFMVQALTIFALIAGLILLILTASMKGQSKKSLHIERLDQQMKEWKKIIQFPLMNKKDRKQHLKSEKKAFEEDQKKTDKTKCYVIEFVGDLKATAVDSLRHEVTAVILSAQPGDEVLIKIESAGGMVHSYGLAAAQILRLKNSGLKVTTSIDKVAASGGYLMACTADHIIAAPFAIIGSIGVVAQVPNFIELLKKNNINYKEYTAGEFKRTVSMLGEITEKGEQKFIEQLEETHGLFKDFVAQYRKQLNLAQVATGEYWYGTKALELGLIDKIQTSDDWQLERGASGPVLNLKYNKKLPFPERLSELLGSSLQKGIEQAFDRIIGKKIL